VTRAPRVLFVDNFDSFSYNVVHLLASRGGLWAPSDHPASPFSIITIGENGFCANQAVAWPDPTQTRPGALDLEGVRFGRM